MMPRAVVIEASLAAQEAGQREQHRQRVARERDVDRRGEERAHSKISRSGRS